MVKVKVVKYSKNKLIPFEEQINEVLEELQSVVNDYTIVDFKVINEYKVLIIYK
ncbi:MULTISPECIES: hypothetical protein [Mammaliicoccus]|uniref:Uncharacterized protein n=1 Tax=Mammaliicoccus sciuri TaxID=1296 RepID=A0AAW5LKH1_MAMSC|nr:MULTISPECIES: hypothetical protein [Mammaliicoccus]MCD5141238.1 hypothetical protein [Mammaliicoccus sciuri]MCQ9302687.1 hypothetical protein [Mammaliicoccus sciuri]MDO0950209.1 hypothetical protein [Mammaliicoccus sciuri]MDT0746475.1 hypothetical protein [Mammaliicoccus sciuri]MDT0751407.1 hypothetical protein [Mammaliicoccus sciuri]